MTSALFNINDTWIIYGCFTLVLFTAFGSKVWHKVNKLNSKYHIITWDNNTIYTQDDEDEDYE